MNTKAKEVPHYICSLTVPEAVAKPSRNSRQTESRDANEPKGASPEPPTSNVPFVGGFTQSVRTLGFL